MAKKIPSNKLPKSKKKILSSKFPKSKKKLPSRKFSNAPKAATGKPIAPALPARPANEEELQERIAALKEKLARKSLGDSN